MQNFWNLYISKHQFKKQTSTRLLNHLRNFWNPLFRAGRGPELKNKRPIYEQKNLFKIFRITLVCQPLPPWYCTAVKTIAFYCEADFLAEQTTIEPESPKYVGLRGMGWRQGRIGFPDVLSNSGQGENVIFPARATDAPCNQSLFYRHPWWSAVPFAEKFNYWTAERRNKI